MVLQRSGLAAIVIVGLLKYDSEFKYQIFQETIFGNLRSGRVVLRIERPVGFFRIKNGSATAGSSKYVYRSERLSK